MDYFLAISLVLSMWIVCRQVSLEMRRQRKPEIHVWIQSPAPSENSGRPPISTDDPEVADILRELGWHDEP